MLIAISAGVASILDNSVTKSHPTLCASSTSPAKDAITFLSWSITTFTINASLAVFAAYTISLCIGLSVSIPVLAFLLSINSLQWLYIIVFADAIPGSILFLPPENPAKKWGSINPSAINKSASNATLFK